MSVIFLWVQYNRKLDLYHAYGFIKGMKIANKNTTIHCYNGLITARNQSTKITYSCFGLAKKLKKNGFDVKER